MTMSIIQPTVLTDAMLTSTTVPEALVGEYAGGTTYALDARCGITAGTAQTVYQSLQAANTGHAPAASPTWWGVVSVVYAPYAGATTYALDDVVSDLTAHLLYKSLAAGNMGNALLDATKWAPLGPTNAWAMFDRKIGTITSVTTGNLSVVIRPGRLGGLGLLRMVGNTATLTLKDAPGGTTVWSLTKLLDGTIITSIYEWFVTEWQQLADFAVTGLPSHFFTPELTLTITPTAGAAACGVFHFGKVTGFGDAEAGASVEIVDWSHKTVDAFGNYDFSEGEFANKNTLRVLIENVDLEKVYAALAAVRAKPCIYIGSEAPGLSPFLVYGKYNSMAIVVAYENQSLLSIKTESLI
jgi:hypothetical protein